jgi:SpoVK/Ycf46/Vps4 family AAA+-type ATPase
MFNWNRIVEKITMGVLDSTLYGYENWLATEAAMYAMEAQETIYSRERSGFLKCPIDELMNKINPNIRKVYDAGKSKSVFTGDNSLLVLEDEGEENVSVTLLSINLDEVENFVKITKEFLERTRKNTVSVLTSSMDGFYLTPIGTLDAPLVRENYTEEVLSGFDFAVKDLKSVNPFGRLDIINGPPGTGKTYLIRGIINELEDSTIVLIPPKMISEIDGPSLLPTFISHKKRNQRPITLIIEDADACLAPRMNDNISSISSLLNHTDGILGALLNLKIIATTNQDNMEFDEALTRAGRLSRHIEIRALDPEKATGVYKRLMGEKYDDFKYEEPTILADIYADARIPGDENLAEYERDPNYDPNPGKRLRRRIGRTLGFHS